MALAKDREEKKQEALRDAASTCAQQEEQARIQGAARLAAQKEQELALQTGRQEEMASLALAKEKKKRCNRPCEMKEANVRSRKSRLDFRRPPGWLRRKRKKRFNRLCEMKQPVVRIRKNRLEFRRQPGLPVRRMRSYARGELQIAQIMPRRGCCRPGKKGVCWKQRKESWLCEVST